MTPEDRHGWLLLQGLEAYRHLARDPEAATDTWRTLPDKRWALVMHIYEGGTRTAGDREHNVLMARRPAAASTTRAHYCVEDTYYTPRGAEQDTIATWHVLRDLYERGWLIDMPDADQARNNPSSLWIHLDTGQIKLRHPEIEVVVHYHEHHSEPLLTPAQRETINEQLRDN